MDTCEVLIVGGGPAGAACARPLVEAGVDVLIVDAAAFPRSKPCAGWVTPRVFELVGVRPEEYGVDHSLQAITGFRTGALGARQVETRYGRTVSYAVRRCEFDEFLLHRSGARQKLEFRVDRLERNARGWIVNGEIDARVIVGAGGHFCPVARALCAPAHPGDIVAARVAEFEMDDEQQAACPVDNGTPEIWLERDLGGYGWLVRKGRVLNVGFGRLGARGLAAGLARFVESLRALGRLPPRAPSSWAGHAYLVRETSCRAAVGEAVLLAGDALGLARGSSGEGIRPAIESGLAAADTLIEARGRYEADVLAAYRARLNARLGPPPHPSRLAGFVPPAVRSGLAAAVLASPWLTRRFLLDRWLADQPPAMAAAQPQRPAGRPRSS